MFLKHHCSQLPLHTIGTQKSCWVAHRGFSHQWNDEMRQDLAVWYNWIWKKEEKYKIVIVSLESPSSESHSVKEVQVTGRCIPVTGWCNLLQLSLAVCDFFLTIYMFSGWWGGKTSEHLFAVRISTDLVSSLTNASRIETPLHRYQAQLAVVYSLLVQVLGDRKVHRYWVGRSL